MRGGAVAGPWRGWGVRVPSRLAARGSLLRVPTLYRPPLPLAAAEKMALPSPMPDTPAFASREGMARASPPIHANPSSRTAAMAACLICQPAGRRRSRGERPVRAADGPKPDLHGAGRVPGGGPGPPLTLLASSLTLVRRDLPASPRHDDGQGVSPAICPQKLKGRGWAGSEARAECSPASRLAVLVSPVRVHPRYSFDAGDAGDARPGRNAGHAVRLCMASSALHPLASPPRPAPRHVRAHLPLDDQGQDAEGLQGPQCGRGSGPA